jgi:hypothetical protein
MARRRRLAWWTLPALLGAVAMAHGAGIWVGDAWYIWALRADPRKLFEAAPPPEPPDEQIEVAMVELPPDLSQLPDEPPPEDDKFEKITEEKKKPEPLKLAKLDPPKPKKIEPKKIEPQPRPEESKPKVPEPPKLAQVKPPPPPPPPPAPKPPPPPKVVAKPPKPAKPPKLERKKMVEVDDDKSVVAEPPPDVNFYSDKNRRPKEETYAKDRNLEKTHKGDQAASEKSPDSVSTELGGKEEKIRQSEDSEASKLDAERKVASVHRGKNDHAEGIRVGEGGQSGENGQGGQGGQGGDNGDGGQNGKIGALSMRDVRGQGAPGSGGQPKVAPAGENDDAPIVAKSTEPGGRAGAPGKPGAAGKAGTPGKRGPKLRIEQRDYTRIAGEDKEKEEIEIAQRKASKKKGKWAKKMGKIQSTLETFSGEVKPGNQTALGTRAHPFAVYISRMHNRIHELWGFGFLADLDGKPQSSPMNNRQLAVTMEIVVAPSGEVERVVIVRPSGVLTFDVAAVDTIMSAGPYEGTPDDIRSGDGFVYIHWTFHRDERMCTPYFADPFILENAGPDKDKAHAEGDGHNHGDGAKRSPEQLTREDGDGTKGAKQVPRVTRENVPKGDAAADAAAAAALARPDDPKATEAAIAFGDAFEKADMAGLMAVSITPFSSAGQVVAADDGTLASVWRAILNEADVRKITEWQVFSAAGYRAAFGSLPAGAADGTPALYLAIRVGKEVLTLTMERQGDGQYKVTGFAR